MGEVKLLTENYNLYYGDFHALKNINFKAFNCLIHSYI